MDVLKQNKKVYDKLMTDKKQRFDDYVKSPAFDMSYQIQPRVEDNPEAVQKAIKMMNPWDIKKGGK